MIIRELGRVDYQSSWDAMRAFTDARTPDSQDELWVCEHNPVFTQGIAGKPEHLLINPAAIPIVQTDRGGQITYHGPGQAMVYLLFNLKRSGYGVRELVIRVENAVIAVLAQHGIEAYGKRDAPGVYVRLPVTVTATPASPNQHQPPQQQRMAGGEAKIAALGLKIRNGHSYHGVAFNVNMDLTPFSFINPCGYEGLQVTHLHDLGVGLTVSEAGAALARELERELLAPAQVRK